jgi:predicted aconitase with swiveling domain
LKIRCKKIVKGIAKGEAIYSDQPINFLSMLNIKTGEINDVNHVLNRQSIKNKILFFPNAIGSSVGAYTIFSLKNNNAAPNGIVCVDLIDITTASACAISNIPLAYLNKKAFDELKKNSSTPSKNDLIPEIILDTEEGFIIY